MSDRPTPRERAIGAVQRRQGLAGWLAHAEIAAEIAAIEEAGLRIVSADEECPRCSIIDAVLSDPSARIFRVPDGRIVVIASDFDGSLADVLPDGGQELVPVRGECPPGCATRRRS